MVTVCYSLYVQLISLLLSQRRTFSYCFQHVRNVHIATTVVIAADSNIINPLLKWKYIAYKTVCLPNN